MLLFQDREPGAEIYGAAAEYKQASLVFAHARGMVMADDELRERSKIFNGQTKAIQLSEHKANVDDISTYLVVSADAYSKHGYLIHGFVLDELHTQPNRDLVDTLESGMGGQDRHQPLGIYITTADFRRPNSICNEMHEYASKVRDGIVPDQRFLPVIYEAALDDDWTDERVWNRANPNIDVSVSRDFLRQECRKAQESIPLENRFKRLHLNIITEQETRFLEMEKWRACAADIPVDELEGEVCYAGLDMSTTTDVTAFVLLFPKQGNAVLPFFWVPSEKADRREKKERVNYVTWAREGAMELTEGTVVDYDVVRARIGELGKRFNIREIAIDRWNSTQIQTQLMGDGFTVCKFGQGFGSMTAPTKELEKLVLAGEIRHGSNPVLDWMISNVAVEMNPAGDLKPTKAKSGDKIDGVVALIMALGRKIVQDEPRDSVYLTQGVEFA
jgi:phage terminase large subunit-like protein